MTSCSNGKTPDSGGNLGEESRGVLPAAVPQDHLTVTLGRNESIAVVLHLEEPLVIAERRVGGSCEHQIQIRSVDVRFCCSGLEQVFLEPLLLVAASSEILHGETGEDRLFVELALSFTVPAVGLLDEEPLFRALLHLHERPLSVELVSGEREEEFPFRHAVVGILVPRKGAPVPHDHLSAAVFVRGDDTFEVRILERVVLRVSREALHGGIDGHSGRDGPRQ